MSGFDPQRLRALRLQRRAEAGATGAWTQAHVAGLVGVSRSYYVLWETGERTPEPAALARLASVLEVDPYELTSVDKGSATMRQRRELRGWTQAEAARRAGLSTSGYAAIERGSRRPSAEVAERLAVLFDVDVDQVGR